MIKIDIYMCICPIGSRHMTKASNVIGHVKEEPIISASVSDISFFHFELQAKLNLLVIMMRKHLLHPSSSDYWSIFFGEKKRLLAEQLRDWQNLDIYSSPTYRKSRVSRIPLVDHHIFEVI